MSDFLGNELFIGDEVVYIKSIRTGSSTRRNALFKGKIIRFTTKMVEIICEYNKECMPNGNKDLVTPFHTCKIK